jgi:hypothetical protein
VYRLLFVLVCVAGLVCGALATTAPADDPVKERGKVCLEVARKGLAEAERSAGGAGDYSDVWVWSVRVFRSTLAQSTNKNERITALEEHLRLAQKLERSTTRQYEAGGSTRLAVLEAMYRRCEVERQLAEERAKPETVKK